MTKFPYIYNFNQSIKSLRNKYITISMGGVNSLNNNHLTLTITPKFSPKYQYKYYNLYTNDNESDLTIVDEEALLMYNC